MVERFRHSGRRGPRLAEGATPRVVGGYHIPQRMGWGATRAWIDDTIAPRAGFPPHPHVDMEIITYVREDAITHRDNQLTPRSLHGHHASHRNRAARNA